jgi:hypothetical protein
MVLVLFGDTHELHREVEVPAGDILICVGDFTMFSKNLAAIEDFNEWLGELPHRHKIVVPGNHEFFLESNPERRSLLDNANVLIDESIEIEGLNIYGSPMTPLLGTAFGKSSPRIGHAIGAMSPLTLMCWLHMDLRSVFSTFLPTRRSGWEIQSCTIGLKNCLLSNFMRLATFMEHMVLSSRTVSHSPMSR